MNEKTLNVTLGEILYWLFFGSLFLAKGLGLYDGQTVFKLILIFAMACLLIKLCIEKYTFGEYLKILFIVLLTGITYMNSGEKGLVLCGLMLIGMKYVDVKRVFQIGTVIWATSFFAITCTSLFHMEDTVFKVHDKLGLGHIIRWSLGYPHPNVLQVSYFVLALLIIYVLGDRFRPKHALWLFVGNAIIFLYSVSYTGFIIFMVLILGRLYLYYRKKLCAFEKGLLFLVYPGCALLSLLGPLTIEGAMFRFLNKVLSTRMELAWRYMKPENYTLFGLRVAEITDASLTMDNAYLFAFIAYGIIPFVILSLGIMYVIYHLLKSDKYLEMLVIVSIAIGGLTEPFLFNTSFKNVAFLFGGAVLFGNVKGKRELSLAAKWNKEVKIPVRFIDNVETIIKGILSFDKRKFIAGIIGAFILGGFVQFFASYPEGYVFQRKECADITKDYKYYEEECPDYAGYKRMGVIEQGDEIEYFSGNIVKMEQSRNIIISVIGGYAVGYIAVGSFIYMVTRKKKGEREALNGE